MGSATGPSLVNLLCGSIKTVYMLTFFIALTNRPTEQQVVLLRIPVAFKKLHRLVIRLEIVAKRFPQCLSSIPAELVLQTVLRFLLCMHRRYHYVNFAPQLQIVLLVSSRSISKQGFLKARTFENLYYALDD